MCKTYTRYTRYIQNSQRPGRQASGPAAGRPAAPPAILYISSVYCIYLFISCIYFDIKCYSMLFTGFASAADLLSDFSLIC